MLVDDAALPNHILHSPALEPLVVSFDWALYLVIAEGNLPQLSVVPDLEGKSAVLVLVNLKDDVRSVDGVLDNTAVGLTVFGDPFQIIFINAVCIGHVHS